MIPLSTLEVVDFIAYSDGFSLPHDFHPKPTTKRKQNY